MMKSQRPRSLLVVLFAILAGCATPRPAPTLDIERLDRTADPCMDFYAYANRHWIEATRIPDDRSTWGVFAEILERNEKVLVAAMEEARRNPPPASTPEGKVARFFASGMDRDAIEKAGLAPLAGVLARADAVRDASSLAAALAALQSQGIEAGFSFGVRPDAKASTRHLVQLSQGGLGLPDRDYYFREDARSEQIRATYRKHVARMLVLAGATEADAEKATAETYALESELARASMTNVERRDPDKTYNKMTLAQLADAAPEFPWREYFPALGAKDFSELNVAQPGFFKAFAKLAAEEPARWRAYLRWHVLRATGSKLGAALAQETFDFDEGVLRGIKVRPPRDREVIETISGRYGGEPMAQALSMIFVEKAFPPESKARMLAMVSNLKAALADRLRTVDWMSDETRHRALGKLAAMGVKIGYPDRWNDFTDADVGAYGYVENWMRAKAFFHRRSLARIGREVDRAEWTFLAPHIVNASYNASGNEITFPAGILQPPFFDPKADDATNYGAIGAVIGHEITHGFDDRGRRYDAKGDLTDWWTAQDAKRYVERAERVVQQYDGYVGVEDIKVNGKLTLGENISDIGGTKIAYLALRKALDGKPEAKVDGYTPEQRFFLSYAEAWRNRSRVENERLQLRTDGHSPARFRVAGVIANLPEFSEAFSCKAGQPLLSEADRANIW